MLLIFPCRNGITRIVQVCIAFAVLLTLATIQPARKQTQARLWFCPGQEQCPVPAVTVDVANTATGVTRSYLTNGDGNMRRCS